MRTADEIRHENLLRLIAQVGSVQAVATKLGKSHAQISQLKNRNKRSGGREFVIGDAVARQLEAAFDLPRGWMDNAAEVDAVRSVVVADLASSLPKPDRRLFVSLTRNILDRNADHYAAEELARYHVVLEALDKLDETPPPPNTTKQ